MEVIIIQTEYIKLDSFLKLAGLADTGGQAKAAVQAGLVKVNGEVCQAAARRQRGSRREELAGGPGPVSPQSIRRTDG